MDLIEIVEKKIFRGEINSLEFSKQCIINTMNPHSFIISKKDLLFAKALMSSDILLPDGVGIVMAARFISGQKVNKIAGADIHNYLLGEANRFGRKVFYFGSSSETLDLIKKKIRYLNHTCPLYKQLDFEKILLL